MKTLIKYKKNHYSLSGEDGVIEEILKRLKINNGWFVEFGAWDGKRCSNTFHLLKQGWEGIDIESDDERYSSLIETAKKYPKLHIKKKMVSTKGESSLDNILSKYDIPIDFDLLSIDTDFDDYGIWQAFKNYKPKIVIIEINSRIMPGNIEKNNYPKRGFTATIRLGKEKGYTSVCHTGNIIFVRNDFISKLNLTQKELNNPNSLFLMRWVYKKPIYYLLKFLRLK